LSLLSRINRLADQLGNKHAPKGVVITTNSNGHGITYGGDRFLSLSIPWNPSFEEDESPDVMAALKPEQKALIGPHDKVCILILPPNGRDNDHERPNTRWV
jgi:hypothetical protein